MDYINVGDRHRLGMTYKLLFSISILFVSIQLESSLSFKQVKCIVFIQYFNINGVNQLTYGNNNISKNFNVFENISLTQF
jgi:hypothetical protein